MNYQKAPTPVSVPKLWLTVFTATLSAILVGGVLLGLGLRYYIRSSIQDAFKTGY